METNRLQWEQKKSFKSTHDKRRVKSLQMDWQQQFPLYEDQEGSLHKIPNGSPGERERDCIPEICAPLLRLNFLVESLEFYGSE